MLFSMKKNKIVSQNEWLKARTDLLVKEKAFTKARDELSQQIRDLPWVKIEKDYRFHSQQGELGFEALFEGRNQLIIYHFMLGPDWEAGCKSCSFWADNFKGIITHLNQRDVSMAAISRAPLKNIEAFKKRMGWSFKWYSSLGSSFNFDFQVSQLEGEAGIYNYTETKAGKENEMPGISVFTKGEKGEIYHTYSRYSRGLDLFNLAYHYLDIVPKGRDEQDLSWNMAWVKHHDKY